MKMVTSSIVLVLPFAKTKLCFPCVSGAVQAEHGKQQKGIEKRDLTAAA